MNGNAVFASFFSGYVSVSDFPISQPIPDKGKHIVQVGGYVIMPYDSRKKQLRNSAKELGECAAKSLKYCKRKSIRLGEILDIKLIIKKPGDIFYNMNYSIGWKATIDVSPEERRCE